MCEMKNSLYEINSRLDIAEEKVNDFEGIIQKLSKRETHREKGIKNKKKIVSAVR